MPAVVTDQFRILNASNFVDTVTGIGGTDPSSSFYVSVSLPNPTVVGFGRTSTWDTATPNPVDNINNVCLLYTSPSPRDTSSSRMPSSA